MLFLSVAEVWTRPKKQGSTLPAALFLTLCEGPGLRKTLFSGRTPWRWHYENDNCLHLVCQTLLARVRACVFTYALVTMCRLWHASVNSLRNCPVWVYCTSLSLFVSVSQRAIFWMAAQFYHRASFHWEPYWNRKSSSFYRPGMEHTGGGLGVWQWGVVWGAQVMSSQAAVDSNCCRSAPLMKAHTSRVYNLHVFCSASVVHWHQLYS